MLISLYLNKESNVENSNQDHKTESIKCRDATENLCLKKENVIDNGGDIDPPIEGIVLLEVKILDKRLCAVPLQLLKSKNQTAQILLLSLSFFAEAGIHITHNGV